MKRKLVDKLKDTSGMASLYVIIMMVFLLPFAIWIGIELPKSHELNNRVKDAVDSASASAITAVATNEITADIDVIPLDESSARKIAIQIFASKMGLEIKGDSSSLELLPPEGSHIQRAVIESIEVLDADDGVTSNKDNTLYVQTKNGKRRIENSTVIVTATVTYSKIGLLGRDITVTHVGMSQAKMNLG